MLNAIGFRAVQGVPLSDLVPRSSSHISWFAAVWPCRKALKSRSSRWPFSHPQTNRTGTTDLRLLSLVTTTAGPEEPSYAR